MNELFSVDFSRDKGGKIIVLRLTEYEKSYLMVDAVRGFLRPDFIVKFSHYHRLL